MNTQTLSIELRETLTVGWLVASMDVTTASTRYRSFHVARGLERHEGVKSHYFTTAAAARYFLPKLDVLVVVKHLFPAYIRLARAAHCARVAVILDVCDDIFIDKYMGDRGKENVRLLLKMAPYLDAITATNDALSQTMHKIIGRASTVHVEIPDQVETLEVVQDLLLNPPVAESYFNFVTRPLDIAHYILHLLEPGASKQRASVIRRLRRLPTRARQSLRRRASGVYVKAVEAFPSLRPMLRTLGRAVLGAPAASPVSGAPAPTTNVGTHEKVFLPLPARPNPAVRRIIWFGNHGAPHSQFGMALILDAAPAIAKLGREIPLELVVVSNNYEKYKALIEPLPFATHYVHWTLTAVYEELRHADVCILPGGRDAFSQQKSANRAVLALAAGVPVVATTIPSLKPLRGAIVFDLWEDGLRRYLMDPAAVRTDMAAAKVILASCFSAEVIAGRWHQLLREVVGGRCKRSRCKRKGIKAVDRGTGRRLTSSGQQHNPNPAL